MFGKKYTLEVTIEKTSIIAAIGFVGACCACFIISQGLLLFIRGHKEDRWSRTKGVLLLASGLGLLVINLIAILRAEFLVNKISQYLEFLNL